MTRIIQEQRKMVRQIRDLLNEKHGLRAGDFIDRMTSLPMSIRKVGLNLSEGGLQLALLAMRQQPISERGQYGRWDFSSRQKSVLLKKLEDYFGPEIKEAKGGMFFSDAAASFMHQCLAANKICLGIKTRDGV